MSDSPSDIARSREYEMKTYVNSMRAIYENAVLQNGEVFDIASAGTKAFTEITALAIISDSRIIKILRYCLAPSISQMKFGQLFGLATIESFERDKIVVRSKLDDLERLAPRIAEFVNQHLDRSRFVWLVDTLTAECRTLANSYAKKWTCSLIADQNAQTEYRNWRKTQQEAAIEQQLISLGYVKSTFRGQVEQRTDINLGEYSKERKVRGGTSQKADVIVRRKRDGQLVLIEAKAVGVQLDAFKRVKECCDKARDWKSNEQLGEVVVVAVIAGFFVEQNLHALKNAGAAIVWEHRLTDLAELL